MLTITEALAEIKTIGKRVQKKREFIGQYSFRQEIVRDPLDNQGGSKAVIAAEFQSVRDLEERLVTLRRAIAKANAEVMVTVGGTTRSIQDWLTWRREVAGNRKGAVLGMLQAVQNFRAQRAKDGFNVRTEASATPTDKDIIVNVDERALAVEAEELETVLGTLDGLLSLKNATTTMDV